VNRRVLLPLTALALAVAAGGATWAVAGAESGSTPAEESAGTTATATVERRDLVQREDVSGTLGYADAEMLYAQSRSPGTVTALRKSGSVVRRGETLYWVDGKPVTLMYGDLPMWRRLDPSATGGRDIRQLERNLVALGYDSDGEIEIDNEWNSATTAAVKRWQEDKGLPRTGAIEPGQIAFLPGARRIGDHKTTRGALLQPGTEVLETSSTRRVVTVDLDADKRSLASEGDRAIVTLPDGRSVDGRIETVGAVAESETDPETGEPTDPTIPVEIQLASGTKTGSLDQAPVDVSLEKETAKNALVVPVTALLSLAEGGFAVEVVGAGGSTRLVRVDPGLFADGSVQISGKGIKKGMKVVVPE
jgi:peptidoglycan hydrolase-like protein with peptidoglycan-binding domain